MLVLSIQCVVACQWLKLRVPKLKLISHILHQFLTFKNIHCTSSLHYLSVLPLKIVLTLGKPPKNWEAGAQKGQEVVYRGRCRDRPSYGTFRSETERTFTAQVYIQHHGAILRPARAPLGPQTTCTCFGKVANTQVQLILIMKFDSLFM